MVECAPSWEAGESEVLKPKKSILFFSEPNRPYRDVVEVRPDRNERGPRLVERLERKKIDFLV